MEAIAVPLLLLRTALGDTVLREGATLGGKVLERNGAHGVLLLAGTPLLAALPESVPAGQRLRLRVAEAGTERVLLQVLPEPPQAAARRPPRRPPAGDAPAAAYAAGAARAAPAARLLDASRRRGAQAATAEPARPRAVTLRYDSPALGRPGPAPRRAAPARSTSSPAQPAEAVAAAAPAPARRARRAPRGVPSRSRSTRVAGPSMSAPA